MFYQGFFILLCGFGLRLFTKVGISLIAEKRSIFISLGEINISGQLTGKMRLENTRERVIRKNV